MYENKHGSNFSEALQAELQVSDSNKRYYASHPLMIPNFYLTAVTKNLLQIDYSWYHYKYHLCIEIQDNENMITYANFIACKKKSKQDFNSFYRVPIAHAKTIIEPNLDKIDEIITNSDYADNLIFLLKDKSYLIVNINKPDTDLTTQKTLTSVGPMIQKFLVNKNGNLHRKKVNTMLRMNLEIDDKACISFFNIENTKSRAIIIDLQSPDPTFRKLKHVILSILHPIAFVLDIVLLPLEIAIIYLEWKLR